MHHEVSKANPREATMTTDNYPRAHGNTVIYRDPSLPWAHTKDGQPTSVVKAFATRYAYRATVAKRPGLTGELASLAQRVKGLAVTEASDVDSVWVWAVTLPVAQQATLKSPSLSFTRHDGTV